MYPDTTSDGKQWINAPYQSARTSTGMVQGVYLSPNQEVEWIWYHGLDGTSYIMGYEIRQKNSEKKHDG